MVKASLAVVAVLLLGLGAWLFEPWTLFTSSEVDEAVPMSTPSGPASEGADSEKQDRVLARGRFEDAEHGTSGRAVVLELADGRRFLRIEDLATSDGPDLHVWLSDQPSGGSWFSYDDEDYVKLGELKATHGNQNYAIPASADLADLTTAVIWCDRFNVAFGTAPLR